jgi:hypothetical protein
MKTNMIAGLVLVAGFSSSAFAEDDCCGKTVGGQVFRDAATHDKLAKVVVRQADPLLELPVPAISEEARVAQSERPKSLVERSEILHSGGLVTLLPKRAVLHLPPSLASAKSWPEGGRLVRWEEFYRNNRGWIKTVEVTRDQAEGFKPLPESLIESMSKSSQVVVATYQGGPISVMPVKVEEKPIDPEITENSKTPEIP